MNRDSSHSLDRLVLLILASLFGLLSTLLTSCNSQSLSGSYSLVSYKKVDMFPFRMEQHFNNNTVTVKTFIFDKETNSEIFFYSFHNNILKIGNGESFDIVETDTSFLYIQNGDTLFESIQIN